jgi:uncharacterized protein (TIGR03435 family)
METLATVLSNTAGRLVVDETGLTGTYDIKLEMLQPEPPAADGTQDPGPSIFYDGAGAAWAKAGIRRISKRRVAPVDLAL